MRNPRLSKINFQSCLKKDPLKEKKKLHTGKASDTR